MMNDEKITKVHPTNQETIAIESLPQIREKIVVPQKTFGVYSDISQNEFMKAKNRSEISLWSEFNNEEILDRSFRMVDQLPSDSKIPSLAGLLNETVEQNIVMLEGKVYKYPPALIQEVAKPSEEIPEFKSHYISNPNKFEIKIVNKRNETIPLAKETPKSSTGPKVTKFGPELVEQNQKRNNQHMIVPDKQQSFTKNENLKVSPLNRIIQLPRKQDLPFKDISMTEKVLVQLPETNEKYFTEKRKSNESNDTVRLVNVNRFGSVVVPDNRHQSLLSDQNEIKLPLIEPKSERLLQSFFQDQSKIDHVLNDQNESMLESKIPECQNEKSLSNVVEDFEIDPRLLDSKIKTKNDQVKVILQTDEQTVLNQAFELSEPSIIVELPKRMIMDKILPSENTQIIEQEEKVEKREVDLSSFLEASVRILWFFVLSIASLCTVIVNYFIDLIWETRKMPSAIEKIRNKKSDDRSKEKNLNGNVEVCFPFEVKVIIPMKVWVLVKKYGPAVVLTIIAMAIKRMYFTPNTQIQSDSI